MVLFLLMPDCGSFINLFYFIILLSAYFYVLYFMSIFEYYHISQPASFLFLLPFFFKTQFLTLTFSLLFNEQLFIYLIFSNLILEFLNLCFLKYCFFDKVNNKYQKSNKNVTFFYLVFFMILQVLSKSKISMIHWNHSHV